MKHFKRNLRAISPVLAVLMMIAVAIAGSLVLYAWLMGYINLSTGRVDESIMIPSIGNDPTNTDLIVYVQNIGEVTVQLEERDCLYVNGRLALCTITGVTVVGDTATLKKGGTATLTCKYGAALPGERIEAKVTTLLGTWAKKTAYPAGTTYVPPVLDHFEFDTIESPQTSGVPFSVTIRAVDQYGKLLTSYSGPNMFYSNANMSVNSSVSWSSGVCTCNVTFTGSATGATVSTAALSDASKNGTSNTFDVIDAPPLEQHVIFEDDFESYTVGTFPSAGGWDLWYDGMGSAYQVVVDNASSSPTQSLKLWGISGWAAYAAQPITTDSPIIGFNVSIRVDSLGADGRDIARVGFATEVPPVYATTYAPILFTDNGTIRVGGAGVLQSYVADRWYKVTVILDRDAETYSVWIDDVLVGENLTVWTNSGPLEPGESSWDMEALGLSQSYLNKNAYFDDVTVFTVE